MLTYILTALALVASVAIFAWLFAPQSLRPRRRSALANVGLGVWRGSRTYLADAVVGSRFLLGKIGSTSDHVALCGVSDIPLGPITDEAAAIGDAVAVNFLGCASETQLAVASAEILAGALIVPAANGKVRTLPTANGSYYIIGQCLQTAAADNALCHFTPITPTLRVVAG